MPERSGIAALVLLLACTALGGCVRDDRPAGGATVFAAASLTEAFTAVKQAYEQDNPGAEIAFNFGSSSGLATQIGEQGGADVLASANPAQMQRVVDAGLNRDAPQVFARNTLQIVVQAGNPLGISSVTDLADPALKVVLAAPQVPVGDYARQVLNRARVTVNPVSEATDAKGVVSPVSLGEADAGIVYATDVKAAGGQVAGVPIPAELNVVANYPVALIRGPGDPEVARAFIDYLLGPRGQQILAGYGFASAE